MAQWLVGQLDEIADVYENDFSRLLKLLLNTGLLLECRRLDEARAETAAAIEFAKKTQSGLGLIHFYGCLAHLHLAAGDSDAAEAVLQQADAIRQELQPVPWQVSVYLRSRAELDLHRLQESVSQGRNAAPRRRRKQTHRSCRALVRQSRKVAQFRTDACRLMGLYHWLTDHPQRALRWWRKALHRGPGARIQIARTHFEIGRRLMEAHSSAKTMDGIEAAAYLHEASKVFEELHLEWDLKRLRSEGDPS